MGAIEDRSEESHDQGWESRGLTRMVRALDRYVFTEFWKIFVATALGFPILIIVIDLTDNLDKYLSQHLSAGRIALSYLYWLPDSMFMILPAAVLFATVFSIGALTRHSEITAAKASGISFYRFIAPIFAGAVIATIVGLILGELAPITNKKRMDILQGTLTSVTSDRYNFAYAADRGRVYKVGALHLVVPSIEGIVIERKGNGPDYPSYVISSNNASYRTRQGWLLQKGAMHLLTDSMQNLTFSFDSLVDRHFTEPPKQLTLTQKAPTDMGFRELGRFITSMERSGAEVNELRVERMLKLAIPVTCIVILLFGAPLATSTQRGGAAYGVGLSLATTVIFLMLIQLMKGVGGKGIIPADLAAWLPSIIFGVVGVILFARVRT
jgi:lipopolysaccharide export system permease protein